MQIQLITDFSIFSDTFPDTVKAPDKKIDEAQAIVEILAHFERSGHNLSEINLIRIVR